MEAGIISTIISGGTMLIATYIGVSQKRNQKHEALRQEGALIQMEMIQAELKLSKVTAKAVLNQKCNGDVEDAMAWAREVEIKYADYMRRVSQVV